MVRAGCCMCLQAGHPAVVARYCTPEETHVRSWPVAQRGRAACGLESQPKTRPSADNPRGYCCCQSRCRWTNMGFYTTGFGSLLEWESRGEGGRRRERKRHSPATVTASKSPRDILEGSDRVIRQQYRKGAVGGYDGRRVITNHFFSSPFPTSSSSSSSSSSFSLSSLSSSFSLSSSSSLKPTLHHLVTDFKSGGEDFGRIGRVRDKKWRGSAKLSASISRGEFQKVREREQMAMERPAGCLSLLQAASNKWGGGKRDKVEIGWVRGKNMKSVLTRKGLRTECSSSSNISLENGDSLTRPVGKEEEEEGENCATLHATEQLKRVSKNPPAESVRTSNMENKWLSPTDILPHIGGWATHSRDKRPLRIWVSTGDVMGDKHAARLVSEVRKLTDRLCIKVEIYAVGGKQVESAGATLVGDNSGMSSIGIMEAVPHVIPSLRMQWSVRTFIKKCPPDVVVLLDYPGVNIPFGNYLCKNFPDCQIIYYIPPNEWMVSEARTPDVCAMSRAILAVHPSEAEYFKRSGGKVALVGHPLLDRVDTKLSRTEARRMLGVHESAEVIALLPASRSQEMRHVWPIMAAAASRLHDAADFLATGRSETEHHQAICFIIPVARREFRHSLEEELRKHRLQSCSILWEGDLEAVFRGADLAITKSGSANLELALYDVPQVVMYRIDGPTAWIGRNILKFAPEHVSLVNVIMEERVVPEFIQENATATAIASEALSLLSGVPRNEPVRAKMLEGYARLRTKLGGEGAAKRAAEFILAAAGVKTSSLPDVESDTAPSLLPR